MPSSLHGPAHIPSQEEVHVQARVNNTTVNPTAVSGGFLIASSREQQIPDAMKSTNACKSQLVVVSSFEPKTICLTLEKSEKY